MDDIFSSECSIYVDSHDNYGKYVDFDTGEIIQSMTIREFCLSDRWKDTVMQLRGMIARYGAKEAKQREDYRQMKMTLPGATLSGLFELREEWDERWQRNIVCSRRQSHLMRHTGFICIDIDLQDNQSLADMRMVLRTLRHRPEVALCMKSCSGTGYFALIRLASPALHKQQFLALMRDYSALGIVIDRKCGDTTRIRYASYDEKPYINENAVPYSGIVEEQEEIKPRVQRTDPPPCDGDGLLRKVETLVSKLELYNIDITSDYDVWFRLGISLATLPAPYGKEFFHRISRLSEKYNYTDCEKKFNYNSTPTKISISYFFARCKEHGITLYN